MEKITLNVEGLSCEHCKRAVTDAVGALEGVTGVLVDLKAKTAAVEYDGELVSLDAIKAAITEEGYDLV